MFTDLILSDYDDQVGHRFANFPAEVNYAPLDDETPDYIRDIVENYDPEELGLNEFIDLYKYYEDRYRALAPGTAERNMFYLRYDQFMTLYVRMDELIEAYDNRMHPDA